MPLYSLLLILGSACIHVVAHVALKRAQDRTAFVWWLLVWGGVLFSPVLLGGFAQVQPMAWVIMAISAVFEALYFVAIAQAYHGSDLSIIYPLARGTAPVFLLIWTTVFLSERPTFGGVGGIFLIALGLYVVNLPQLGAWSEPLRALNHTGPRWALLAGLCISLYTVIDRQGINYSPPLLYTYLALWLTWLFLTPWVLYSIGWAGLVAELRSSKLSSVVAGFTTLAAYAVVLYVMQSGALTSYIGAVREISVVLGAAIGIFVLKEKGTLMRVAGAALVAVGVVVIKLLG